MATEATFKTIYTCPHTGKVTDVTEKYSIGLGVSSVYEEEIQKSKQIAYRKGFDDGEGFGLRYFVGVIILIIAAIAVIEVFKGVAQ